MRDALGFGLGAGVARVGVGLAVGAGVRVGVGVGAGTGVAEATTTGTVTGMPEGANHVIEPGTAPTGSDTVHSTETRSLAGTGRWSATPLAALAR